MNDLPKENFVGRHYSNNEIKSGILDGQRRGAADGKTGQSTGAESSRLSLGRGAPPGVYVYDTNSVGEPAITSRKNMYVVQGPKSILDIAHSDIWKGIHEDTKQAELQKGTDPDSAHGIASNEAEHAIKALGYDGYRNTESHHPGIVFLFGDQAVSQPQPNAPSPKESPLAPGQTK